MFDRYQDAKQIQECVRRCLACEDACQDTSMHLVASDSGPEAAGRRQRLADCGSMCQTTVGFLLRGSPYAAQALEMCADICEACAEECMPLNSDAIVLRTIELCGDCESACRNMETMSAGV